tara:strand:+ start:105 stop:287 length:183 start_codon:yes stop_codon:yes gene_type:complete
MRATEFLYFLSRKKIDAETHDRYSHFEYRDLETDMKSTKMLDKYRKIRREYRKNIRKDKK